jgi:hypothetical protein
MHMTITTMTIRTTPITQCTTDHRRKTLTSGVAQGQAVVVASMKVD